MAPRVRRDQPIRAAAWRKRHPRDEVLAGHHQRDPARAIPRPRTIALQILQEHARRLAQSLTVAGLLYRRERNAVSHQHHLRPVARHSVRRQALRTSDRAGKAGYRNRWEAIVSRAPNDCVLCAEDGGRLIWRDDVLRVIAVDEPRLPGYTRVVWQAHI